VAFYFVYYNDCRQIEFLIYLFLKLSRINYFFDIKTEVDMMCFTFIIRSNKLKEKLILAFNVGLFDSNACALVGLSNLLVTKAIFGLG